MDAIKGFRLERLPYVLTLQLKRFDLDYTTFSRIKLNDQVRYPRILNMNPYLGSKLKQTECNEDTDFEKYMSQERERLKTSQSDDANQESEVDEYELPDLVDVCGQKAPSQLAEEEAVKKAREEEKFSEDEDPDPAELVRTQVNVYTHSSRNITLTFVIVRASGCMSFMRC